MADIKTHLPAGPHPPVRILHVPDCPNTATMTDRVVDVMSGQADIELQVVRDQDQAEAMGMCGSPTLLINGIDPFAVAGQAPSLSCRLYRDEQGAPSGAPTVEQLRMAVARLGVGS